VLSWAYGALEDELAEITKLSMADLRNKLEAAQPFENLEQQLGFINNEIWLPMFSQLRTAILRLAREVEELRAAATTDDN
jgi:hypothetical protein